MFYYFKMLLPRLSEVSLFIYEIALLLLKNFLSKRVHRSKAEDFQMPLLKLNETYGIEFTENFYI